MGLRKDLDKLEKTLIGVLNKGFPFEEDWHVGKSGVPRSSLDAQSVWGHQQHNMTVKLDLNLGQTLKVLATYEGWMAGKKIHMGSKFLGDLGYGAGKKLPTPAGTKAWFAAETKAFRAALKKTYDYMGEKTMSQSDTPNANRMISEAMSKRMDERRGDWAEIDPSRFEGDQGFKRDSFYRVLEYYSAPIRYYLTIGKHGSEFRKGEWVLWFLSKGGLGVVAKVKGDPGEPGAFDFDALIQRAERYIK